MTPPDRSSRVACHLTHDKCQRGAKDWRREWDSNPRYGFPHTRFPSVRLKPLGHLSGAPSLEGAPLILQEIAGRSAEISLSYCISMRIY